MALLFPIVILAVFTVLFAQHGRRDLRARRYLDRVEAELVWGADAVQAGTPPDADPRLPHHLQHVIAAAYAERDSDAAARKALAAIAEYRAFRGWKPPRRD